MKETLLQSYKFASNLILILINHRKTNLARPIKISPALNPLKSL